MQLILPSFVYENAYREYIQELGDEERYPSPLGFDHNVFDALLAKLTNFRKGIDLPDGFVPATIYWLVEDNDIVGVTNLRHYLIDRIRHAGGLLALESDHHIETRALADCC